MLLTTFDIALAIVLTYFITDELILSAILSGVLSISLFAFRSYDPENLENFYEQLVRFFVASILSVLVTSLIYSIFRTRIPYHRTIASLGLLFLTIPLLNFIFSKAMVKYIKPKKYLVIGREEELKEVLNEITEKTNGKYIFQDFVNPSPTTVAQKITQYDHILIGDYELYKHAEELIKNYGTKTIEYLPTIAEKVLKRIPIVVIDKFREYYEIEFEKAKESPTKRIIDVIGSIVGLILFSPFMLISAIFVLIEDGKPVVFKQLRVGKDGKYFDFIKLRSLKKEGYNPVNPNVNIKDRQLKIGKIIRPTRIDETLQFWLVLKGQMSLVGPRPEMIEYHRMCESNIPYYNYRLKLKPGITGWAQINFSHTTTIEEYKRKTEFDLYYIKNRSTLLDLRILLQTIETVFWRRGAK